MAIHVRIWTGTDSARVTDMTYAGKRGKRCRVLRVSGAPEHWLNHPPSEAARAAAVVTVKMMDRLASAPADMNYDDLRAELVALVADLPHAVNPDWRDRGAMAIFDEEIKGVEAPRPVLTAGVPGKWSAEANEEGIRLADLADDINMPREITPSSQTGPAAYAIAAKVWFHVIAARSMSEAAQVLRDAGAKLHYFCAMD